MKRQASRITPQHATFAIVILFASFNVHAKTASEVYEQAAKSTVVVGNIDAAGKLMSFGSGVVLSGGSVVTNCHVVKDASQLKVRYEKKEFNATLRYSDWDRDICSLNVPNLGANAAEVGNTKTLKVGAKVYAIGAPKGLELSLSDGIVSSLREVEGGHYIQTTAAISPGSSGGGLFDENGALVGLTTFYLTEGQNLNFAVPVEWIKVLDKRSTKAAVLTQPVTQWVNKAIELENKQDWTELLEHCRRWIGATRSGDAWYVMGIAYHHIGQTDKAIEAYLRALSISPEYAETWDNLGISYVNAGQPAKAIEAHQQALRINPEQTSAWNNLGFAYNNAGQANKAIEAYQQALRINPVHTDAWNNLGIAYYNSNELEKAADACQQALRINPDYYQAWNTLGVIFAKANQIAKSIEDYQQALLINPEYAEAWNNLGNAYGKSEQIDQSINAYHQALRINPKFANAWNGLGMAYARSGQRGKVLEVYKQLKILNPTLAERFFNNVVVP